MVGQGAGITSALQINSIEIDMVMAKLPAAQQDDGLSGLRISPVYNLIRVVLTASKN